MGHRDSVVSEQRADSVLAFPYLSDERACDVSQTCQNR